MTLLLLIALTSMRGVDELPSSFRELLEARKRIERADIEWSVAMKPDPRIPHRDVMRFRGFFARDQAAVFPLGGDSGLKSWVVQDDGHYGPDPSGAKALLRSGDTVWQYDREGIFARVWTRPPRTSLLSPMDVRFVGMHVRPDALYHMSFDSVFPEISPEAKFTEEKKDGLYIVTAEMPAGGMRWVIDPAKGWNPVRCEQFEAGVVIRSCTVEYDLSGGAFVPRRCEYRNEATGETEAEFSIDRIEVNTGELPETLEPEHIGIENGMSIADMSAGGKQFYYYDGKLIEREEFNEGVRAGRYAQGPGVREFRERRGERTPAPIDALRKLRPLNRLMDDWERYTREFIRKYRLDAEQTGRALAVLSECQQRRDQRRADFDRRAESDSLPEARARRQAELNEYVQRIFDDRLKPQLFKLPREEQIRDSGDPEGIRKK